LGAGEELFRADCTFSFTLLVGGAAKLTAGAAFARAVALAPAVVIGNVGKTTATAAISPSHDGIGRDLAHFWSAFIHPLS
jgi:hypothetical protein